MKCFKAYDIRGRVPDELNEDIAYRIGRAFAQVFRPREVVVGRDVRVDSLKFANAVARDVNDAGASVIDIGLCGTEEVHFQTAHRGAGGCGHRRGSHRRAELGICYVAIQCAFLKHGALFCGSMLRFVPIPSC